MQKEAYALFRKAKKFAGPAGLARRDMRQEGRSLLGRARKLGAGRRVGARARHGGCATNTGLDSGCLASAPGWRSSMKRPRASGRLLDSIARSDRIVLAGDHCQLPHRTFMNGRLGLACLEAMILRRKVTRLADSIPAA